MENLPPLNSPISLGDNNSKINFFSRKIVFCILGAILFLAFFYFFFFSAPSSFPKNTVINIKEGSSLRSISKYLEQNHMIRSRAVFETFVIIFGGEKRITTGDYLFEDKLPVFEVAKRISKGERNITPIKITIPEGFNISEISKVVASKLPNFNVDKFLSKGTPKEGYLFPDTYFFYTLDNEEDVLHFMSDNFQKKIDPILPKITSSGKTEKDIIIMASIIEKESKGDIDRKIISGILWKRIALGMPLQVDADKSTYNTKGLPKNPISNPGLKAIESALYPEDSPYLYYLHDKDGNVHYAKTFAEHKINKLRYLK